MTSSETLRRSSTPSASTSWNATTPTTAFAAAWPASRGVHWVELDVALGRIVVAFDDDQVDLEEVISVSEAVEEAHGTAGYHLPHDEPEHPADPELLRRHLTALSADAAGLGLGLFGRALRSTPLPVELAGGRRIAGANRRLMHRGHEGEISSVERRSRIGF